MEPHLECDIFAFFMNMDYEERNQSFNKTIQIWRNGGESKTAKKTCMQHTKKVQTCRCGFIFHDRLKRMNWRRILYDRGPWFSWVRAVCFRNQVSLIYIYRVQRTPHIWGLLAGLASKNKVEIKKKKKKNGGKKLL